MGYSAQDEQFLHQLPRPLDQVHDENNSWSDRCYFNAHSPDGRMLLATGYGNNPNTRRAHGYIKVALADGRHWDLDAGRKVLDDRADLFAGPMRWTCVEPLQHWLLELGPNSSGIEWELHYRSRAPMWELLPIEISKGGRTIVDMFHMKQSGTYTGWVSIDGERISADGFGGGRDRTFGVRAADEVDFWLWFEANFDDCAIEAWVWESADGTVNYVDGGITYVDGRLSQRFVKFEHDVRFDGNRKRPSHADIVFTDEAGVRYQVTADAEHQNVNVHYGRPPAFATQGIGLLHYSWDSNDPEQLATIESGAVSMDQLMRFEMDGKVGRGIFELLMMGERYPRYPNWGPMDISFAHQ